MRPLQLEISGFRSHRDLTTIDFSHRTLLAIVGPIGAGKSSILDAICYALYGKTPRIQRDVRSLVCSRSDAAHVRLRFSVAGGVFEARRSIPRRGQGEHVLTDVASGDVALGAREVTARVEELLGLSFDAFRSSVLLAQYQFSKFLDAPSGDRTKILKGVFRVDQITALHAAAKARLADVDVELAGVTGALGVIPDDVEERHAARRDALASLADRVRALEAALPEERRLTGELHDARAARDRASERAEAAAAALARVPPASDLDDLATEQRAAEDALVAARATATAAEDACAAAERALEELRSETGDEHALYAARAAAREHAAARAELEDLERRRAALEEAVAGAERAAAGAAEAEAAARGALARAARERAEAERSDMAHALREHLTPGEPCPVCEQVVAAAPAGGAPPALDAARA
ncbi:MAG TPA: SMC family ATPase, partial [Actinomycetota bacterium]|nr:SMC family ATPase [Actinomycetota bacterium]